MDVFSGATGIPTVTSRAVLSKFLTGEIHDFLCRRFLSLETFQLICTQLPHHSCLASSQTAHPPPTVPITPPLPTTRPNPLNQPSPSSSLSKPPATPTCMSTNNEICKVPQERVVREPNIPGGIGKMFHMREGGGWSRRYMYPCQASKGRRLNRSLVKRKKKKKGGEEQTLKQK